jgi:hypothetical protein
MALPISDTNAIWWDSDAEKLEQPLEDFWGPPLPISLTHGIATYPLGTLFRSQGKRGGGQIGPRVTPG